jgi:diguanylate cyclase (GGDEF)-like protein
MSKDSTPPFSRNAYDFSAIRFETFRSFSVRLGFLVASFPLLTLLPDCLELPDMAFLFLLRRGIATLLLLIYPLAMVCRAPRRALPWVLYGSVIILFFFMVHEQTLNSKVMQIVITGTCMFFLTPLMGILFSWKENLICELVLLLVIVFMLHWFLGLSPMFFRLATVGSLMVFTIDFINRQFERLLRVQHSYLRRIEKMAIRDALTGQYNRRYFFAIGSRVLKQSTRSGRPASMAILDLDHFKSVNDRFGHDAGDVVLRETAHCVMREVRETDLVARLGGEEFVILLPEANQETGRLVAERIRQAIAALSIPVEGPLCTIQVTASLGLAEAQPGLDSLKTLLKRADQALYRAKQTGRNRVALAGPLSSDVNLVAPQAFELK